MKKLPLLKTGVALIAEERERQIEIEGYTTKSDDALDKEQLAYLAACYVIPDAARGIYAGVNGTSNILRVLLPQPATMWKPTPHDRVRELQKAGALIAAEIDRINRFRNKI